MDDNKQWVQSITADDIMRPREPDPFAEWAKRAAGHRVAIREQCGDEEPRLIAVIDTDGSLYAMPDAEAECLNGYAWTDNRFVTDYHAQKITRNINDPNKDITLIQIYGEAR